MQDVNARIVVSVTAGESATTLSKLESELNETTKARYKLLEANKNATEVELLNIKKQILAKKQERALNTIGFLVGERSIARKSQDRKKVLEVDRQILLQRYKTAQAARALAQTELALAAATGQASTATQNAATQKGVLRIASRMLNADLGHGSAQMAKFGIIAAGIPAVMKLVSFAIEYSEKSIREYAATLADVAEQQKDAMEWLKETTEMQNKDLETIEDLHFKDSLNPTEALNYANAVKNITDEFGYLGIKVDSSTGKIIDMYDAIKKVKNEQIRQEIDRLQSQVKVQQERRKQSLKTEKQLGVGLTTFMKIQGFGLFNDEIDAASEWLQKKSSLARGVLGTRIGASDADIKAEKDTQREAANEEMRLRKRIHELKKQQQQLEPKTKARQETKKKEDEKKIADIYQRQDFSLASELNKYRSSTQTAVFADSAEALRLQSRYMMNSNISPAQKTAEGVDKLVNQTEQVIQNLNTVANELLGIKIATTNFSTAISGAVEY